MIQVALKFLLPGIPDLYQSCLGEDFSLTDPDNRRAVDLETWPDVTSTGPRSEDKAALTKALLSLRSAHPELLTHGETQWQHEGGHLRLDRRDAKAHVSLEASYSADGWSLVIEKDGSEVHRAAG